MKGGILIVKVLNMWFIYWDSVDWVSFNGSGYEDKELWGLFENLEYLIE